MGSGLSLGSDTDGHDMSHRAGASRAGLPQRFGLRGSGLSHGIEGTGAAQASHSDLSGLETVCHAELTGLDETGLVS